MVVLSILFDWLYYYLDCLAHLKKTYIYKNTTNVIQIKIHTITKVYIRPPYSWIGIQNIKTHQETILSCEIAKSMSYIVENLFLKLNVQRCGINLLWKFILFGHSSCPNKGSFRFKCHIIAEVW